MHDARAGFQPLVRAKAGAQSPTPRRFSVRPRIPAFAGMSGEGVA
jgi:hypothetical protein